MTIRDMDRRTLLKTGLMSAAAAGAATIANTASAKPAGASEMHFDVVVLGAGCAGLSAALEAADKGAKVALLDKMFGPFGNTIYAGGHFNATNTFVQKRDGLSDTLDEFYKDMMDVSIGRGDPELTRMYVEKSGECIQWLTDRVGIQWKKMHEEPWPATVRGHVVDGPKKPGGAQLTTQLLDAVKASKNITLFFNTKAIELLKTPALACTGVRAVTTKGEVIDFHAKGGVIIATGGFHNNKEMICKYMGGGVAWMPLRGAATLTGENIELTRPFFPQYVNMDQYHSGPIHGPTKANPSLMVNYGIIVNKEAQRIIDEVNTYVYIAKKLPQITPDNWAYIIIDQKVVDVSTVASRIARYKKAKAPIYEGQTIAELAKAMNVPIDALEKTVADYNAAVKSGKSGSLTPPNTLKNAPVLDKGPFLAFPFQGGMTATFGGPKISKKAEVLNTENRPVPGLYAAGNAIGGLFYDDYIVGSQLTAAVIWGRVAGEEAAGRTKR